MDRLIFQPILEDLKSKMVFIGGPRQCGKTFLAKEVLKAFHYISDNLTKIETNAAMYGTVIPSAALGKFAVGNYCNTCGYYWNEWRVNCKQCPKCASTVIVKSVFGGSEDYRKEAVRVPPPSKSVLDWAKNLLKPNTIGIFARGRTTYGRNLPSIFYVNLINKFLDKGYHIVWLGEKSSTIPCPVKDDRIIDFACMDESRDLEKTLAIVCHLQFTIQFWTASTRLSGMMGTPYILFESPEQIYCTALIAGQEGIRLDLMTFGNKKLVLANYMNVLMNLDAGIELACRAADELVSGNYEDIIGMVEVELSTKAMGDMHRFVRSQDGYDCIISEKSRRENRVS
jgi:hypothetical protein